MFTALFFKGGEWKFAEEGGEYVLVDKEGEEMVGWFEGEVGEVEKGVKEELEMCKRDEVCFFLFLLHFYPLLILELFLSTAIPLYNF